MHAESPPRAALNYPPMFQKSYAESPPRKTYSSNTYRFFLVVDSVVLGISR